MFAKAPHDSYWLRFRYCCFVDWLSVPDAARRLRVSDARVRLLIRRGDLAADRIGGRWLLDADVVERFAERPRRAGRPFAVRSAWGLLAIVDDRSSPWLSASERSRLERVVECRSFLDFAGQLRRRAAVDRWHVHSSLLSDVADEDEVVLSGPRGSDELGRDRSGLEIYVPATSLDRLRRRFEPVCAAADANLVVRSVEGLWPFGDRERRAWPSTVALDLLEEHPDDPRCRDVALRLLSR